MHIPDVTAHVADVVAHKRQLGFFRIYILDPAYSLDGLRLIYELNRA